MNGFAALDIPPCRRYVVVKATAGFAVCRLILKLLLFYSCLDFTQNLGKTQIGTKIENSFTSPLAHCVILTWYAGGLLFCLIPHEPQTAPRHAPKCSCGLCGFLCYVVNGLQNHTPNPYKIAFSSFTIRVRISCSSVLQSKSRR